MKCVVTGWETDNKWKGMPVGKESLQLAREYVEKGWCDTIRNALVRINREFLEEYKVNQGKINFSTALDLPPAEKTEESL